MRSVARAVVTSSIVACVIACGGRGVLAPRPVVAPARTVPSHSAMAPPLVRANDTPDLAPCTDAIATTPAAATAPRQVLQTRHTGRLDDLAFAPDGTLAT